MPRSLLLASLLYLTVTGAAQSALTLEYWSGVQDFTPYVPVAPSQFDPQSLQGLRNWDFTGQSKLNSLSMQSGSQYIVKVVLRDHDSVGNGSGYTMSGTSSFNNHIGLTVFAFKFGYVPGTLNATRDANGNDSKAETATVWLGTGASVLNTGENPPFAVANYGTDYFTLGGLFLDAFNGGGVTPFQQANGDVLYPLANVVLTAGTPGTGVLSLTQPTTPPPSFAGFDGVSTIVSYDNAVWSSGTLASLGFTVSPVPEPTSLLFGGLVVSAIGYRRRLWSRP